MVADTVESITPHKMRGVRSILNSSAMDILYYTSPIYRSEVSSTDKQRERGGGGGTSIRVFLTHFVTMV